MMNTDTEAAEKTLVRLGKSTPELEMNEDNQTETEQTRAMIDMEETEIVHEEKIKTTLSPVRRMMIFSTAF
jgi:hypothetical protein